MANLGEVVVQIRAEMAQFKRAFKDASRQLMSFTRTSRAALARLSGAVVAFSMNVARHIGRSVVRNLRRAAIAMVALGVASVKAFSDFQGQMAQVSTMLTQATMHLLPGMTEQVQKLSIAVGQSTKTLTEGLFDILSAQIPAAQALDFLTAASETAVAGSTDVKTATSALITVMEAYGKTAADVNDISDKLFATMVQGRVTFGDVAQNIGSVAAQAAIAGIDLESMATMFATISRVLDPFKTQTALRALFTELRSPTKEQEAVAKDLGIEWRSTAFQGAQLIKTMKILKTASTEQLATLMPNVRGFAGLAAAIMKVEGIQEAYNRIVESGGSTAEAYGKIVETMGFQFKRFGQAVLATMRTAVEPFSVAIVDAAEKMANFLRDSSEEIQAWATTFKTNVMAFTELFQAKGFLGSLELVLGAALDLVKEFTISAFDILGEVIVAGIKAIPGKIGQALGAIFDGTVSRIESFWLSIKAEFSGDKVTAWQELAEAMFGEHGAGADAETAAQRAIQRWTKAATKIRENMEAEMAVLGIKLTSFSKEHGKIMAENMANEWADTFKLLMQGVPGAAAAGGADTDDVTSANEKAAATVKSIWKDTSDSIAGAMSGAFADIATSAKSMTEALTDMLNQIHRALSQEVFMQLLWPSIKSMAGLGAVQKTAPTGPVQPFEPHARGGLVGQGMGRVMYAASGLMVPRGGDTVPIMATPGEEVVEKPIVDYIKRTQAQPPAMTINVNSVTGRDAYAFLNDNKRTIASMMQSAMSGNHPLRRDR